MAVTLDVEHRDRSGLRLRVVGAVDAGPFAIAGDPFAVVASPDGALVVALCDGTWDWGSGHLGSRVAAPVMARIAATAGPGDRGVRLAEAMEAGGEAMCAQTPREVVPATGRISPASEHDFPPACFASLLHVAAGRVHVAWIGAGPLLLLRDGAVVARTRPHLFIDDAVAAGHLTAEEARVSQYRHVVTRALGGHDPDGRPTSHPEIAGPWELARGDRILLCYERVADTLTLEALPALAAGGALHLLDEARRRGALVELAAIVVSAD